MIITTTVHAVSDVDGLQASIRHFNEAESGQFYNLQIGGLLGCSILLSLEQIRELRDKLNTVLEPVVVEGVAA